MIKEQKAADGRALGEDICPVCGYEFDCASESHGGDARPKPGDFSFCMKCGELFTFDQDMSVRVPTVSELAGVPQDVMQDLDRVQRLIRKQRVLG